MEEPCHKRGSRRQAMAAWAEANMGRPAARAAASSGSSIERSYSTNSTWGNWRRRSAVASGGQRQILAARALRMAMTTRGAHAVDTESGPEGGRGIRFPRLGLAALVAVPDAIVEVAVADRAQALVVEHGDATGEAELVFEAGEVADLLGPGGALGVGGLEEFLVAAVNEQGQLAVHDQAGRGGEFDAAVGGSREHGGATELAREHLALVQRLQLEAQRGQFFLGRGQRGAVRFRFGHSAKIIL